MSERIDQAWLTHSNAETMYHLERQGRTGPGLVPFLGAGISTAYGLKDWRHLLLDASPPRLLRRVTASLDKGDYEGAAELLLKALGPDGFQNMVAAAAGDTRLESFDLRTGTVSLLPLLGAGPVVTTNFDRLVERAFEIHGAPFESVISGPRPDLIVDALHGNRHVLIKLHGDWQDRVGRTFARSDYDTNYGKSQPGRKRELLESAEFLLFSSRSLLFIGASLGPDRTVGYLEEVHARYAGIRHFAIMTAPASRRSFERKEAQLRKSGVMPLWYYPEKPGDHSRLVNELLEQIVERISVQTIAPPGEPAPTAGAARARVKARHANPALAKLAPHFERLVTLIESGRLTFFLGSAIHAPTKLLATEFYVELARVFECEALRFDRSAVAQYIADRHGRANLDSEIRKLFARTNLVPRETHAFFGAWPQFRTSSGEPLPFPTVITTNYDDTLECTLAKAGVPYHLLSYQASGPHRGLFYHRTPEDGLRLIERPGNIRDLSDAMVIVKLNGGFDRQRRIPETYATARLDYVELASRIPDVLPAVLRRTLSLQPLLFLGNSLNAQDIESVVRFAHRGHAGPRSWAVVLGLKEVTEYWRQNGVEVLDQEVGPYVTELHRRLTP
jgi:hypothetical protein